MYIQPNTTIKFLQNIPFDADYNDTVYFYPSEGQAGQAEYFDSFTKYTINENYYQRVNKGELKVQLPYSTGVQYESTAEKLYDCNYMMFRNTNFGNKWFYAFIKNVEWVNNETAKITYELDVMQTWFFDYDLEQCFVEREHTTSDNIGDNLVPENLDLGYEMVTRGVHINDEWRITYNPTPTMIEQYLKSWAIVMVVSKLPSGETYSIGCAPRGSILAPVPKTLSTHIFYLGKLDNVTKPASVEADDWKDWDDFSPLLLKYLNSQDGVVPEDLVMLYLCPAFLTPLAGNEFVDEYTLNYPTSLGAGSTAELRDLTYTPNNKKLLTYPYIQLVVSNQQGSTNTYKYEYFSNLSPKFSLQGVAIYNPSMACIPIDYQPAAVEQTSTAGIDYAVISSDFPQVATPNDAFLAWWAQNKSTINTSNGISVLSGVVSALVGGAMVALAPETGGASMMGLMGAGMIGSGVISAGGAVAKSVAKKNDAQNMPNSVSNLSNTPYLTAHLDLNGFKFYDKSITSAQAKIIDDYFTMFGYACHEVKTPNRHARPHWTYTQTVGCTIKARCPGDDQKKICQIYDKGIRFWSHDTNTEIGKYYNANGTPIDNSPTAG